MYHQFRIWSVPLTSSVVYILISSTVSSSSFASPVVIGFGTIEAEALLHVTKNLFLIEKGSDKVVIMTAGVHRPDCDS